MSRPTRERLRLARLISSARRSWKKRWLYNHRFFHERLAEEIRRANRSRSRVGLLIYDIDDFKRVNDTYGHLSGDQVLQGVASISREICRQEDVICRIGGEEFAVILPGATLED